MALFLYTLLNIGFFFLCHPSAASGAYQELLELNISFYNIDNSVNLGRLRPIHLSIGPQERERSHNKTTRLDTKPKYSRADVVVLTPDGFLIPRSPG